MPIVSMNPLPAEEISLPDHVSREKLSYQSKGSKGSSLQLVWGILWYRFLELHRKKRSVSFGTRWKRCCQKPSQKTSWKKEFQRNSKSLCCQISQGRNHVNVYAMWKMPSLPRKSSLQYQRFLFYMKIF